MSVPDWAAPILAVVAPIVGALAWLFRLEGRVNLNASAIADIKDDVEYIRNRVDAILKQCMERGRYCDPPDDRRR